MSEWRVQTSRATSSPSPISLFPFRYQPSSQLVSGLLHSSPLDPRLRAAPTPSPPAPGAPLLLAFAATPLAVTLLIRSALPPAEPAERCLDPIRLSLAATALISVPPSVFPAANRPLLARQLISAPECCYLRRPLLVLVLADCSSLP